MVEREGDMYDRGAGNWHSDGVWGISWLDLGFVQIGGGSNSSMGCDLRARVLVGGFGVMWRIMSPMCLGLSFECDDSHTQPCLAKGEARSMSLLVYSDNKRVHRCRTIISDDYVSSVFRVVLLWKKSGSPGLHFNFSKPCMSLGNPEKNGR